MRKIPIMKTEKTKNVEENTTPELMKYFYSNKNTNFFHLFKITNKYTEFYKSSEAKLAIIVALILSMVWVYLFNAVDISEFNIIIRDITSCIFIALIGMLGFIISGLAILSGTITVKVINQINKLNMSKHLIGVLYSFYFIGVFIGVSVFAFIAMYLLSFPDFVATDFSVSIISFILSYMFCFSVFYSIALLGTCLKIFVISYKFANIKSKHEQEEK